MTTTLVTIIAACGSGELKSGFSPPPGDAIPTANANGPYSSTTGSAIAFSSVGSFDPEGSWTAAWDFGDGATSTAINPSHSYTSTGSYTVALTVTDQANQSTSDNASVTITAGPPPPPPPTSGPYPNEPAGAILLMDYDTDFDNIGNPPWNFIRGASNLSTITDLTAPVNTTKVGQVEFPVGCSDGSGPANIETFTGTDRGTPPATWSQWYVSDWIKFGSNFQPHGIQKIFRFVFGNDNSTHMKLDGPIGGFPRTPRITTGWAGSPQSNHGNGAVQMQPDVWYQFEFIHHSSGRLQLWGREQGSSPVVIYDGTPHPFFGDVAPFKYIHWWWGYGGNGAYPWNGNPALGPGHIYHNNFRVSYLP